MHIASDEKGAAWAGRALQPMGVLPHGRAGCCIVMYARTLSHRHDERIRTCHAVPEEMQRGAMTYTQHQVLLCECCDHSGLL